MCFTTRQYYGVTGTIFFLIALMHLIRAFAGWPAAISSVTIPVWLSLVTVLVAGFLSYNALWLMRRK